MKYKEENGLIILSKGPNPDHVWFSFFLIIVGIGGIAIYYSGNPLIDNDIKMAGFFGAIVFFSGVLIWLNGYWKITISEKGSVLIKHGILSWKLSSEDINDAFVRTETIYGRRGRNTMYELTLLANVNLENNSRRKIKDGQCVIFEHTRDEKDQTYHQILKQLYDLVNIISPD
ncbi:MAG TPA: hypothetical protein PK055_09375 [Gammaproteobacteria bacterium]|nr:hypothetical protein [Xanthomonadales bacterium]MCB1593918.1 hypothetical protein [Xanthomonadales bacterium]HOP22271.1 hypothetical protein [Gammaproteobacteria bacterium]HPI96094.1 hypothetical protein [Gammaproteobacteria bacterium]HPQ87855.1 hypothetical protein [Gammaproteobacteria bacterium]